MGRYVPAVKGDKKVTDINKLAVSFKSIGKSSERKMTARLRRHAYESGWPVQLGRVLEVKHHDDGDFSIQYPAHLESEVLGIEWGSLDIPENPVMLRTSNRMDDLYDSHLSKINVALSEVKYI
jgi:hypothetical protein